MQLHGNTPTNQLSSHADAGYLFQISVIGIELGNVCRIELGNVCTFFKFSVQAQFENFLMNLNKQTFDITINQIHSSLPQCTVSIFLKFIQQLIICYNIDSNSNMSDYVNVIAAGCYCLSAQNFLALVLFAWQYPCVVGRCGLGCSGLSHT